MEASNQVDFLFCSDEGVFWPGARSDSVFAVDFNPVEFGLIVIEIDWVEVAEGPVENLVATVHVKPE